MRQPIAILAALFAALLVVPAAQAAVWGKSGTFSKRSVKVGSATRTYRAYIPRVKKPLPVLIAYHGAGGNGAGMAAMSKLDAHAKRLGFIAVYPNGLRRGWDIEDTKPTNKDVRFTTAMIADISKAYKVDQTRIYAVGFSLGTSIVSLLGKHLSTTLAAIANHSGGLGYAAVAGVTGKRKIPVMVIHGKDDRVVPYAAALQQHQFYRQGGHTVEVVGIPRLGHRWATAQRINDKLWTFFKKHALPKKK